MTPEVQQYLIYGALMLGGFFLRHLGVTLPGMATQPSSPTPPVTSPTPAQNAQATDAPNVLPAASTKPLQDFIDSRLHLLEQRLTNSAPLGNDQLATALASLAHRLIDQNKDKNQSA